MELERELERQLSILTQGAQEILPVEGLREKLKKSLETGRPLRVKLGIDPTAKDVHLGHMVPYRKLRQFQDLGHNAVLIIGDFTAMIGDPTGRNKERPGLTFQEVELNAQTYCSQIFKVIDPERVEVHRQSEWFNQATLQDTIQMASEFSVAHLMSHETFKSRIDRGTRLSLHELFYPLLQAWDSLAIEADIELGGMDQKFNILCGRDLQRSKGMEAQTALFMPLLSGTDGKKMSKTGGNSIAVLDSPQDIYGKTMSIADELLPEFLRLASSLKEGDASNPYQLKKEIAFNLVEIYHGKDMAEEAEAHFRDTVSKKETPHEIPQLRIDAGESLLVDLIAAKDLLSSKSEARRMIQQGGVKLDGQKCLDLGQVIDLISGQAMVLQVGKRKFYRLIAE